MSGKIYEKETQLRQGAKNKTTKSACEVSGSLFSFCPNFLHMARVFIDNIFNHEYLLAIRGVLVGFRAPLHVNLVTNFD